MGSAISGPLQRASAAGEWDAVMVLARELEARRKARAEVVELPIEREAPLIDLPFLCPSDTFPKAR